MKKLSELNKCKKCGGIPEMRCSFGGPVVYYGIYCKCGNDNRKYNSEMFAYGLVCAGGFPPSNRDEAIRLWNNENSLSEVTNGDKK
jgi:hypothetical protein